MPSRRTVLASLGTAGFGSVGGCFESEAVSGRWPRAGYDDQNTGHTPDVSGPGANPTVKWSTEIPEGVFDSSPVLVDDRVYLGYGTNRRGGTHGRVGLLILDAGTGEIIQDVTITTYDGEQTIGALYRDSVVYENGTLYLLAFDGLYSLTPTGERRWHVPMNGGPANSTMPSGHPVVVDGTVFAPTASITSDTEGVEALYAIDDETGEVRWRYVPPVRRGWTFPPAYEDGVVYVAALDYGLVALDADSGEEHWRAPLRVFSPPTVTAGRVCVSLEGDEARESHVVAVDTETGDEDWRSTGTGTRINRRIAASDGRIYYREHLSHLVARYARTGEEVWRYADAGSVHAGVPAVTDDALYAGVDMGGIDDTGMVVLDTTTGDFQGFAGIGTDTSLDASIALTDGFAFATASIGRIYAFEACPFDLANPCPL